VGFNGRDVFQFSLYSLWEEQFEDREKHGVEEDI